MYGSKETLDAKTPKPTQTQDTETAKTPDTETAETGRFHRQRENSGTVSAPQETELIQPSLKGLLFEIRLSVRYHVKRQRFYESWERWSNFGLLVLGSATVGTAFHKIQGLEVVVGLLVTLLSALKITGKFAVKTALHSQFVKDFTELEKQLVANRDEETVQRVHKSRLTLEATEPAVMINLSIICYNEEVWAQGYNKKNLKPLNKVQRFLASWKDWRPYQQMSSSANPSSLG